MSLTIASQQTLWKETPSKTTTVITTLPSSFDKDLESGKLPNTARFSANSTSSYGSYSSEASFSKPEPLPAKRYHRWIRHIRYTFMNVYRRLFSIVFLLNLVGVALLFWRYKGASPPAFLADLANAASGNIMVAIAFRQDYIINILYRSTWFVPLRAPLRLRRLLAKIYAFGGVHSGCSVSSVMWFCILTAYLTQAYLSPGPLQRDHIVLVLSYLLVAILVALCITAYPRFRFKSHNTFENVHRWGGWLALALFWVQICFFANSQVGPGRSLGRVLVELPAFWFLLISSGHTIFPWLRYHKMPVRAERLSDHAIRLYFDEKVPCFVGVRISDAPLKEWHSFAVIPARSGDGGSVLISHAGDWTRKTIDNPQPYYYIKGVPTVGVLCMARIFRKIVVVTTGSGIGPVLGVIQDTVETKYRVIWSTPDPIDIFGRGIVDAVLAIDNEATIINTRKQRRPDLLTMAWEMYSREKAEAVFVISNAKLTKKIVYGLESRGVPCYGPIWDS